MDEPRADMQTEICDLRSIDLSKLDRSSNPVLAKSIQRILREADESDAALSFFNSSI